MRIEITYPKPSRKKSLRAKLISILKWPFLFAAYICPIINIATGGKAWSVIVLWSIWVVWSMAISPSLIEYNRISQFIGLIVNSCILLTLIGVFLSQGWAAEVVPIVCFCGLFIAGILFFTDLERQKQNMLPLLLLIFVSISCSVIGLIIWHGEGSWSMLTMGALALALLIALILIFGASFIRELKKRFYTK